MKNQLPSQLVFRDSNPLRRTDQPLERESPKIDIAKAESEIIGVDPNGQDDRFVYREL